MAGDISTVMSPRTVITWAENRAIFNDLAFAFRVTFLNKCDELERPIIAEYYQRCFGTELPETGVRAINGIAQPHHLAAADHVGPAKLPLETFKRATAAALRAIVSRGTMASRSRSRTTRRRVLGQARADSQPAARPQSARRCDRARCGGRGGAQAEASP